MSGAILGSVTAFFIKIVLLYHFYRVKSTGNLSFPHVFSVCILANGVLYGDSNGSLIAGENITELLYSRISNNAQSNTFPL